MLPKLLVRAVLSCAALRCAGAGCVSSQTGSDTFVASRLSSSPDLELDHPSKKQAASNSLDWRDCTICLCLVLDFRKIVTIFLDLNFTNLGGHKTILLSKYQKYEITKPSLAESGNRRTNMFFQTF